MLWGNHVYFRTARVWDAMVRNDSEKSSRRGGRVWRTRCTINKEFRLHPEGSEKPDIKQLLQESNMIRFEAYKDHIGNMEDALMEQAWRQGNELQGYFISLD